MFSLSGRHTILDIPNVVAIFRGDPPTGSKIAIFDQCLALRSMTVSSSSSTKTAASVYGADRHSTKRQGSVNVVYNSNTRLRSYQSTDGPKIEQN